MFKPLLPFARPKLPNNMALLTLTPQHILIRTQPFQPHRSSRVNPSRTNPDFGTKTISIAIGESGGGVDKGAGGVDTEAELGGVVRCFGDYCTGVVRGVGVDVGDCGLEGGEG